MGSRPAHRPHGTHDLAWTGSTHSTTQHTRMWDYPSTAFHVSTDIQANCRHFHRRVCGALRAALRRRPPLLVLAVLVIEIDMQRKDIFGEVSGRRRIGGSRLSLASDRKRVARPHCSSTCVGLAARRIATGFRLSATSDPPTRTTARRPRGRSAKP